MYKLLAIIILFIGLFSCSSNPITKIKNQFAGKLKTTVQLKESAEKKFVLDEETAPNATYIQMYKDSSDLKLTLLNPYNHSIYMYNYADGNCDKRISFNRKDSNSIRGITGYYIKNMDSIYVYSKPLFELVLFNNSGYAKKRIHLLLPQRQESKYLPQYDFRVTRPIIEKNGNLILTGLSPFNLNQSSINKFHFTACFDMKNNQLRFYHSYPNELYGNNYYWDDPEFMEVYSTTSPNGNFVYSFPVSHNLYISPFFSDSTKSVYAGSNIAKTISSMNWNALSKSAPRKMILTHYLQQDLYGPVLYDHWRNVYYRFMLQGIPKATTRITANKKAVIIIVMDQNFKYLGETNIGLSQTWNWANSFVTKEGLNVQYLDSKDTEEKFLQFKIFTINKL